MNIYNLEYEGQWTTATPVDSIFFEFFLVGKSR